MNISVIQLWVFLWVSLKSLALHRHNYKTIEQQQVLKEGMSYPLGL